MGRQTRIRKSTAYHAAMNKSYLILVLNQCRDNAPSINDLLYALTSLRCIKRKLKTYIEDGVTTSFGIKLKHVIFIKIMAGSGKLFLSSPVHHFENSGAFPSLYAMAFPTTYVSSSTLIPLRGNSYV